MMRSMTGYGQAMVHIGKRTITIEVRAVNQRFLEVKIGMPREYLPWEAELRGLVQQKVGRGKVDVAISRNGGDDASARIEPNLDLAKAYVDAWRLIQRKLKVPGEIGMSALLARPEVVRAVEGRGDPASDVASLRSGLERALDAFNRERDREGRALARDMAARGKNLAGMRKRIAGLAQTLKPQLEARLRQRLETLLVGREIKEERLLQEAAFLADRSDVTEELVRIESHLAALVAIVRGSEAAGKKLEFLLQELNREFNTIASKANDLAVTNLTMEAKAELEKLREQAQNVE